MKTPECLPGCIAPKPGHRVSSHVADCPRWQAARAATTPVRHEEIKRDLNTIPPEDHDAYIQSLPDLNPGSVMRGFRADIVWFRTTDGAMFDWNQDMKAWMSGPARTA